MNPNLQNILLFSQRGFSTTHKGIRIKTTRIQTTPTDYLWQVVIVCSQTLSIRPFPTRNSARLLPP